LQRDGTCLVQPGDERNSRHFKTRLDVIIVTSPWSCMSPVPFIPVNTAQFPSRDSTKPNELAAVSLRVVRRIHFCKTVQVRWQLPDFVDRPVFTSRHARRTANTSPRINEKLPGLFKASFTHRRVDGVAQAYRNAAQVLIASVGNDTESAHVSKPLQSALQRRDYGQPGAAPSGG
jgi:hypothetical protein